MVSISYSLFLQHLGWLLLFTYLCICPFSVISGGVVFVLKKCLKLSNSTIHSGYLRVRRQEEIRW